jgi:glycine betaine transporter
MAMRAAAILIALISILVLAFPEAATSSIGAATAWFIRFMGLPILWMSTLLLVLCMVLVVGPWGGIRLGSENEQPEFSTFSWLSMLFGAGMGSGLMFWGVAEPLTHFSSPPVAGQTPALQYITAMAVTYFHWGWHAWAIYAISGLVVAWFSYRFAAPEVPSGALRVGFDGWLRPSWIEALGATTNVVAIAAVVFGMAGALANGTILVYQGLGKASGLELPVAASYALILGAMGIAFLASANSGIQRGILWLSNGNIVLAVLLLVLVLWQMDATIVPAVLWDGFLRYVEILPEWSVRQAVVHDSLEWSGGWTITYLLWWIAWTPFVGIFIARISRGRTIRGYILGVVVVPTVFSMVWFAVMGGGAFAYDLNHGGVLLQSVSRDYTEPLFLWFSAMGSWGPALSYLACVLLFIFLVTGADSASYVMGMLSRDGDPNPPMRHKMVWGGTTVLLAGGLLARQSADVNKAVAIAGAIPYAFLLLLQLVAWTRSFWCTAVKKGRHGK